MTNRSEWLETETATSAGLAGLESEIPATHPEKGAIEEAIRAAFVG